MNYWLGVIGTWLIADGFASIWAYTQRDDQGWLRDHSVRIFRALLGIILIWMGAVG